jgi:hypothetical protein
MLIIIALLIIAIVAFGIYFTNNPTTPEPTTTKPTTKPTTPETTIAISKFCNNVILNGNFQTPEITSNNWNGNTVTNWTLGGPSGATAGTFDIYYNRTGTATSPIAQTTTNLYTPYTNLIPRGSYICFMFGLATYIQQDIKSTPRSTSTTTSASTPVVYKVGTYTLQVIVLSRRDTTPLADLNYNINLLGNNNIINNSLATVNIIPAQTTSTTTSIIQSTSNNFNVEGTVIIKLNISAGSSLIGQNISVRITNNSNAGRKQIFVVSAKLAIPESCNDISLF